MVKTTISRKEKKHNNLEDMINDRLRNKVDSNGERFYFSVAEEVPLYRKDHKNLIGCIDNVAIHIGANRKKYIALFEVKSKI